MAADRAPGKTTVTVTEPGGKKAKLNVSVVDPAEGVELSVKGKKTPGGTVTVTAKISPKSAGNKAVKWSLDVGEDVATINSKGQIKISKKAESSNAPKLNTSLHQKVQTI